MPEHATSFFIADFFKSNRATLRARVGSNGPIVLTANGLLQRGADVAFPFAQDANFWYLTGITEPDITLVSTETEEFLIVPPRETSRATFDGAIDEAALSTRSGITTILDETNGWKRLDVLLARFGQVLTPEASPGYIEHYGMYTNPARARLIARLRKHGGNINISDIRAELAAIRMIKQEPELLAIRQAIAVTTETLAEITDTSARSKYGYEYELEAALTHGFLKRGSAGHSFEPIIAGGKRACTLHNLANNGALRPNELVVLDVGAEVEQYAADITRTIAIGTPSSRQQAVYDAVLEAQEYALSLLRPGVILREYEQKVETFLGKKLKMLELVKRQDREHIRAYYPHAASHFLGLNVHDAGDYEQPLQPGVVVTCEPGIYIPEEGIGVRIEDDVLITETGNTVLSSDLPRKLL